MLYYGTEKISPIVEVGSTGGWTGHVDVDGLTAIGWDSDDIARYQKIVDWDEEDDDKHLVSDNDKEIYNNISAGNPVSFDNLEYSGKFDIDVFGLTNMDYLFYENKSLIALPFMDLSFSTSASSAFYSCSSLQLFPQQDFSNVTNANDMFAGCVSLTYLGDLNFVNCTDISHLFNTCLALKRVGIIDCDSVLSTTYAFTLCVNLREIYLKNIGVSFDLGSSLLLTHECLTYIINNAQTVTDQTMTFGTENLAKLTDEEISVATNRGWTVV